MRVCATWDGSLLLLLAASPSALLALPTSEAACASADLKDTSVHSSFLQLGSKLEDTVGEFSRGSDYDSRLAHFPKLEVNLDEAAELRWTGVIDYWVASGLWQSYWSNKWIPFTNPDPKADDIFTSWFRPQDEEVMKELQGMVDYSRQVAPSLNLSMEVILLNRPLYDWYWPTCYGNPDFRVNRTDVACEDGEYHDRGMLAAMPNGTVLHATSKGELLEPLRSKAGTAASQLAVEVTFTRNGKPLFRSVHVPGQVGVASMGIHSGGWSLSALAGPLSTEIDDIKEALDAIPYNIKARRVMENAQDFETAVQIMQTGEVAPPLGAIRWMLAGAGPYQGAVIDRNPLHGSPTVLRLSKDVRGYRAMTADPVEELKFDEETLSKISPSWMLGVMSKPPYQIKYTSWVSMAVPRINHFVTTFPADT